MSERIGDFWTVRGFFYKGKLLAETPTHYKIFDFKTSKEMELLKTSVERVEWSEAA